MRYSVYILTRLTLLTYLPTLHNIYINWLGIDNENRGYNMRQN